MKILFALSLLLLIPSLSWGETASSLNSNKKAYISLSTGVISDIDIHTKATNLGVPFRNDWDLKNPTHNFSFAIGKKVFDDYRVELNFSQTDLISQGSTITSNNTPVTETADKHPELLVQNYQVFLYRDFNYSKKIKPYLGIGAGRTVYKSNERTSTIAPITCTTKSDYKYDYDYAVKTGLNYQINDTYDFFSEITYQNLKPFTLKDNAVQCTFDTDYGVEPLTTTSLGVRMKF